MSNMVCIDSNRQFTNKGFFLRRRRRDSVRRALQLLLVQRQQRSGRIRRRREGQRRGTCYQGRHSVLLWHFTSWNFTHVTGWHIRFGPTWFVTLYYCSYLAQIYLKQNQATQGPTSNPKSSILLVSWNGTTAAACSLITSSYLWLSTGASKPFSIWEKLATVDLWLSLFRGQMVAPVSFLSTLYQAYRVII